MCKYCESGAGDSTSKRTEPILLKLESFLPKMFFYNNNTGNMFTKKDTNVSLESLPIGCFKHVT